jgi:hypothetical protein
MKPMALNDPANTPTMTVSCQMDMLRRDKLRSTARASTLIATDSMTNVTPFSDQVC